MNKSKEKRLTERQEAITGKERKRKHVYNKKTFILIMIHGKSICTHDLGIIYGT